jgi:opacity protein-like surface antigen
VEYRLFLLWCSCLPGLAIAQPVFYAGAIGGLSTLSGDARSSISSTAAAISLYKPENGGAANLFAGVHWNDYLSVQGNYIWNSNDVVLISSRTDETGEAVYEQARGSAQHAAIGDVLLYFRRRSSWVRPYLSAGVGVVHVSSRLDRIIHARGALPLPPEKFSENIVGLRVAVGIDVAVGGGWAFRYSFSETISRNPFSRQLTPPAERDLKNFQNLFGFVKTL